MMKTADRLLYAFEVHDAALIRKILAGGIDPNAPIKGKVPVLWLMEMYTRSAAFADCLRALLEGGAALDDLLLKAILLDDESELRRVLGNDPQAPHRRYNLECAYVSFKGVTPLHICAEYNSVRCGRVLLEAGADIDARADVQADGTGGHTPLFHTVNSNCNHCRPMMELLAEAGASLNTRVEALVWGGGFEWETVFFDVTPIAFAQCGLYPQVHRKSAAVHDNIDYLYRRQHGCQAPVRNVPNKYLR